MRSLLPFVFILICPLMMLFMMRGMHGHGGQAADKQAGSERKGIAEGSEDQSVADLREQRDQLEVRVQELEAQMSRLAPSEQADPRVPTAV